jgi:hypothetical protein
MNNSNKFLGLAFATFALFLVPFTTACGGSLRREVRTDTMTAVADPLFSSTDTRGATDFCLARLNSQRDEMLTDYCRVTGGCSEDSSTETTTRLSLRDFCAADPTAAVCEHIADISDEEMPVMEVVTRTTGHGARTTGADSGMAFFATSSMSAQYTAFCMAAGNQFGSGIASAPSALWGLGATGMSFASASFTLGLGTMGGSVGLGGRPYSVINNVTGYVGGPEGGSRMVALNGAPLARGTTPLPIPDQRFVTLNFTCNNGVTFQRTIDSAHSLGYTSIANSDCGWGEF